MIRRHAPTWIALLVSLGLLLNACQTPSPTPTPMGIIPSPILATTTPTASAIPATAEPTAVPTSALGAAAEALRGIRVHFWFAGSSPAVEKITEQIRTFNASNPYGIWVEGQGMGSYGEVADQVNAAINKNDQPDLVLTYPILVAGLEKVDLDAYINDPEWGLSPAELQDIPVNFLTKDASGKRTSLPGFRSALVLAYNQSWARELGFNEPPKTPGEFQEQACAAKDALRKNDSAADNGLGGWIIQRDQLTAASWLRAFGSNPWQGENGRYTFNTPESTAALQWLRSMFDQGCAWIARNPQPYTYFANRQALFYVATPQDLLSQERVMGDGSGDWTVIGFPGTDGNQVTLTDGPDWMMFQSNPAEQLAAWYFTHWMLDPGRQAEVVQASGDLPVKSSAKQNLAGYSNDHPQWARTWELTTQGQEVPPNASWRTAAPVLQDAFGQVFSESTTLDLVPVILEQLDQVVKELLERPQ